MEIIRRIWENGRTGEKDHLGTLEAEILLYSVSEIHSVVCYSWFISAAHLGRLQIW